MFSSKSTVVLQNKNEKNNNKKHNLKAPLKIIVAWHIGATVAVSKYDSKKERLLMLLSYPYAVKVNNDEGFWRRGWKGWSS